MTYAAAQSAIRGLREIRAVVNGQTPASPGEEETQVRWMMALDAAIATLVTLGAESGHRTFAEGQGRQAAWMETAP